MAERLQAAVGVMWSRQAEFMTPYVEAFETLAARRDELLEYVTIVAHNPADLDNSTIEARNLSLQDAFKDLVRLSVQDGIPGNHNDLTNELGRIWSDDDSRRNDMLGRLTGRPRDFCPLDPWKARSLVSAALEGDPSTDEFAETLENKYGGYMVEELFCFLQIVQAGNTHT